ncbi:hypothetical protein A2165_02615 [Candidatus Curtissbacteria bacterium RBG_13_40_7]|uniref:Phage holin family protein n=1 Tax=Candidatus Curtissbacteria bacterium RBG_13_40_7 TaxID=1797706 RepID=A0A1F5FZI3_9BACT|nr:MAG: hypothetical protein A2165_02615 [Candidatus Curtissbacteria bacterium RBG_13_40_7]
MDQKKLVDFLSFWVTNTVLLLIISAIFRANLVLGNNIISKPVAAIISGFFLTALIFLIPPIVDKSGYKIKNQNIWPGIFLVVNIVVIWLIKRFAVYTGVGISSIWWVLIMAVVLTAAELIVVKLSGAMAPVKKGK